MVGMDRRIAEQLFHDQQAAERAVTFAAGVAEFHFDDAAFLDHETWVRPAFEMLGDLHKKAALDYGCGHGMAAVVMARAGATVTAIDLSPGYVAEAQKRATANSVDVFCTTADGENLPFANDAFDAIWGNAILHHLDLTNAGRELARVLKPGGVAVFCEPWGGNPLLRFARRWLPYPGKDRTADERPLCRHDLAPLRPHFPDLTVTGHQLLGMMRRVWNCRAVRMLDRMDSTLLQKVPAFSNWCRYAVIRLEKPLDTLAIAGKG